MRQKHTIEGVEIKSTLRLTFPESQIVCSLRLVSRDHNIICNCQHFLTSSPGRTATSIIVTFCVAVEPYFIGDVEARKLPSWSEQVMGRLIPLPPRGSGYLARDREPKHKHWMFEQDPEPVLTNLKLVTLRWNKLLKYTIFVSQAITPDRELLEKYMFIDLV